MSPTDASVLQKNKAHYLRKYGNKTSCDRGQRKQNIGRPLVLHIGEGSGGGVLTSQPASRGLHTNKHGVTHKNVKALVMQRKTRPVYNTRKWNRILYRERKEFEREKKKPS